MPKARKNIHDIIREETELAKVYAKDGAFRTAARIFAELAAKVQLHAEWVDEAMTTQKYPAPKGKGYYEVIVQNIGRVHEGTNLAKAKEVYAQYVSLSRREVGRAANENVSLFKNGEIIEEYTPLRSQLPEA